MAHAKKYYQKILVLCAAGLTFFMSAIQAEEANIIKLKDRQVVFNALLKSHVLNKDRQLVHFSHVCNLRIDGRHFPVIDLMELVPGANTPRGVNRIIILNDELAPIQTINYITERPLFCKDRQLFVFGEIMVKGVLPEGNVLAFFDGGRSIEVRQIDVNKLPIPINTNLKTSRPPD